MAFLSPLFAPFSLLFSIECEDAPPLSPSARMLVADGAFLLSTSSTAIQRSS